MARGVDINFANGWQKTGKSDHSDRIRKQGTKARNDAQLAEKAKISANQAQAKSKASDVVKTQLSRPVGPGKDIAQTHQKIRPETQDQAARQSAQEFLKARTDANKLGKLSTSAKLVSQSKGTQKATETAVTQKAPATESHPATRQGTQQAAHTALQAGLAHKAAQKGTTKQTAEPKAPKTKGSHKAAAKTAQGKTADAQKALKTSEQILQPENAAHGAALAGMSGHKGVSETARTGLREGDIEEDGVEEEEHDSNTSTFAKGASRSRSTGEKLTDLLGGSAGESESDSLKKDDGTIMAEAAKNAAKAEPLPEKDDSFHVYSEYDEANPRIEHVKSKAQVFARLVEKRLKAIAKFDHELEGKIKDMFEIAPLSKRIIGELAPELKTAEFLKSIYGGVIG